MREGSKPSAETQRGSVHESPVRQMPHAQHDTPIAPSQTSKNFGRGTTRSPFTPEARAMLIIPITRRLLRPSMQVEQQVCRIER